MAFWRQVFVLSLAVSRKEPRSGFDALIAVSRAVADPSSICIQVVLQRPGLDPGEVLDSKHQLAIERLARLGEFGEQQPRHLVHRQVNVSVREDFLVRVPLGLVQPDGLLGDGKEQQAPAEDLSYGSLGLRPEESLVVLLDEV
ncbi:hypothetical protein V493_01491 [Pseudogymnoascus sp. VKM F-4281 (FW-2241)]|nr:hypothetical protein V493_01491 [Pseudogymnoascus sp. VKM F-4281 (FW-2241)]